MWSEAIVLSQRYAPRHYQGAESALGRLGVGVEYSELTPVREMLKAGRAGHLTEVRRVASRTALAVSTMLRDTQDYPRLLIVGLAPYDWRAVPVSRMGHADYVVYYTSWAQWDPMAGRYPRRPAARSRAVQAAWKELLERDRTAVAAVSSQAAKAVEERFRLAHRPTVTGHVIADQFFEQERVEGDRSLRVAFVGRLEKSKGIDRFLSIAERCGSLFPSAVFTVAGSGTEARRVRQAARRGVVEYAGSLTVEELADLYARSSILLMPGRRSARWEEVFGMVAAEAALSGVHVLATDHTGPRWLAELTEAIEVCPEENYEASAIELVRSMVKDELSIVSLGATRQSLRRFALPQVTAAWEQVVQRPADGFNDTPKS